MTTYTITAEQLATVRTQRKQLLDSPHKNDHAAAALLNWAETLQPIAVPPLSSVLASAEHAAMSGWHTATKERYAIPPDDEIVASLPPGVVVSAYRVKGGILPVKVERVQQIEGSDLWAVRHGADVLNVDGEWEYEPMPSSRDDAFLARCRFLSSGAAIAAAMAQGKR